MKKLKFLSAAVFATAVLFSSCSSEDESTPNNTNNPSACAGTDVTSNTWAVIKDGQTTTVTMGNTPDVFNSDPSDDQIEYVFYGQPDSMDMITFTFKGENPPASGTYTVIDSTEETTLTASNQALSIGTGSGTAVMGGGLFSKSGTFTVTNNDSGITLEGKGLKYSTAMGNALCVSFKVTKS